MQWYHFARPRRRGRILGAAAVAALPLVGCALAPAQPLRVPERYEGPEFSPLA